MSEDMAVTLARLEEMTTTTPEGDPLDQPLRLFGYEVVATLVKHIRELQKRIGELEAEVERLCDPLLKDMRLENGEINMSVAGPIVERMALAITGTFRQSGAKNYMEFNLNARTEPFERYCVTVQKVGQNSPHQFRQEAEQALTAERQRRESAEEALKPFHDTFERAIADHVITELDGGTNKLPAFVILYRRAREHLRKYEASVSRHPPSSGNEPGNGRSA